MKERPILFSAPMVRSLLNCTKSQTRRVMKPQPRMDYGMLFWPPDDGTGISPKSIAIDAGPPPWWKCPHGQCGDRLWVREKWKPHCAGPISEEYPLGTGVKYAADEALLKPARWTAEQGAWCEAHEDETRWRPSIFMPRWASRITLEITGVRVERLNEISGADCIAEGIIEAEAPQTIFGLHEAYRDIWESINGPGSWILNPWVWVIEFRRIEA